MTEMAEEIWKPIPSAPGWLASSLGRICKPKTVIAMPNSGVVTREIAPRFGHLDKGCGRFKNSINGRTRFVAPLICEAFHGPRPFPTAECMHLDESKTNNKPDNLAWGTKSQNQSAPKLSEFRRAERASKGFKHWRLSSEDRESIKSQRHIVRARVLAAAYGISHHHVYAIWQGTR